MSEALFDATLLARLQFAVTGIFHIIWPVLTIGLSLFLVLVEGLWLKTGKLVYYHHLRFWMKLLLLNFGVGVVTGIPLEFEFGTNWAPFAGVAGGFFGNVLGFEAAMAFMLEAGFLGIMVFGWNRVSPAIHYFATCVVAFAASMSAFWIMSANAWMQTPAGGELINGRYIIESYREAIFNPNAPWAISHMWLACLQTSVFVIGGISAWYILRRQHIDFFLHSFKIAVLAAVIITPLQVLIGDGSGLSVHEHQPAKLAAIEGHWETNPPGKGADWALLGWPDKQEQKNVWSVEVPNVLSWLVTHSATGQVKGLREFAPEDQPPAMPLLFYGFRGMVAIGMFMMLLAFWGTWLHRKGAFTPDNILRHSWLLRLWMFSIPLGYVAVELGWIVREVGRQPWLIYGIYRTQEGASALPVGTLAATLITYTLIYISLTLIFIVLSRRLLFKGPDLTLEPSQAGALQTPLMHMPEPDNSTRSDR
ncbi:MAG: cytochrome ubiquinol oxidase subunit I [Thiohalophilus sp.]|jgi:cytochrome d ubiquinol oxidase subunit I